MFKIPAWEEDIPKSDVSFGRKANKKQKGSKTNTLSNKEGKVDYNSNAPSNEVKKIPAKKLQNQRKNKKKAFQSDHSLEVNKTTTFKPNIIPNGINKGYGNKHKQFDTITKIVKNKRIELGDNIQTSKFNRNIHKTTPVNGLNKLQSERSKYNDNPLKLNTNNNGFSKSQSKKLNGRKIMNRIKNNLESDIHLPISNHGKTTQSTTSMVSNKSPSKKRKHDANLMNTKKKKVVESDDDLEVPNLESDVLDEAIINVKKKKLNEAFENDDKEDVLFAENTMEKRNLKKERMKSILQKHLPHRTSINTSSNKLRERMMERLKAAQFRYLNEKLYTSSGSDAQKLFQSDPVAFQTYHEGYQQQVKKWPVNPLDVIVKRINKMPKSHVIADMGCGEAALSKRVAQAVRSFDLVAAAPGVEPCDMAHTPLLAAAVDCVVYCLALMGTDLATYLQEANRVLKIGGHLLIAEVESRFDKVDNFTKQVEQLGFKLKNVDKSNNVFYFMEFTKNREAPVKKSKLPALTLKPCLYKKR